MLCLKPKSFNPRPHPASQNHILLTTFKYSWLLPRNISKMAEQASLRATPPQKHQQLKQKLPTLSEARKTVRQFTVTTQMLNQEKTVKTEAKACGLLLSFCFVYCNAGSQRWRVLKTESEFPVQTLVPDSKGPTEDLAHMELCFCRDCGRLMKE